MRVKRERGYSDSWTLFVLFMLFLFVLCGIACVRVIAEQRRKEEGATKALRATIEPVKQFVGFYKVSGEPREVAPGFVLVPCKCEEHVEGRPETVEALGFSFWKYTVGTSVSVVRYEASEDDSPGAEASPPKKFAYRLVDIDPRLGR